MNFKLISESVVLFAIRGCLPKLCYSNQVNLHGKPGYEHQILRKNNNYRVFGCSIGIWWKDKGKTALFPGSTVPSLDYLHKYPEAIRHFNILCPGKYNLIKGIHPKNISGFQRHNALLMLDEGWIQRPEVIRKSSKSTFNFNKTMYNISFPGDNLHASRTQPLTEIEKEYGYNIYLKNGYSSSGCITVAGQPEEYINNHNSSFFWNSWKQFIDIIYTIPSKKFSFLLFDYHDFAQLDKLKSNQILRFGSSGKKVLELQKRLTELHSTRLNRVYYSGELNGVLNKDTAMSFMEFRKDFLPHSKNGEINFTEFNNKTKHFVFTIKHKEYAIN